jgi:DNA-binding PadR family transcriptional regulator
MKNNLTDLREAFIINLLSNTKTMDTNDLLKNLNQFTKEYFIENNFISDKYKNFKQVSPYTLSLLLKDMRGEKIIERDTVEKKEGRGPPRYTYRLVNNEDAFFKSNKKIAKFFSEKESDNLNLYQKYFKSPYAKYFIDNILFETLQSILIEKNSDSTKFTDEEKNLLSRLFKISTKAVHKALSIIENNKISRNKNEIQISVLDKDSLIAQIVYSFIEDIDTQESPITFEIKSTITFNSNSAQTTKKLETTGHLNTEDNKIELTRKRDFIK